MSRPFDQFRVRVAWRHLINLPTDTIETISTKELQELSPADLQALGMKAQASSQPGTFEFVDLFNERIYFVQTDRGFMQYDSSFRLKQEIVTTCDLVDQTIAKWLDGLK